MRSILAPSVLVLAVATALLAHGGLVHTMGTVAAIDAKHVVVKTQNGKTVSIDLAPETKYVRGKAMAKLADVAVGSRVMVESKPDGDRLVAAEVHIGTGPQTDGAKQ